MVCQGTPMGSGPTVDEDFCSSHATLRIAFSAYSFTCKLGTSVYILYLLYKIFVHGIPSHCFAGSFYPITFCAWNTILMLCTLAPACLILQHCHCDYSNNTLEPNICV